MAKCRRRRKMCRTRCRSRSGRFKRCRSGDRRYRVQQRCCRARRSCGRRRRRRSGCRRLKCIPMFRKARLRPKHIITLRCRAASQRATERCVARRKTKRSAYLYLWRCRSRSGSFKRCRRCDRRYKIRRRRSRS
ncbi:hypothetical protein ABMA28_012888 [Loxostege sticticalis]|uniref:Sperm protamine P1 n=1 Tax=Loxostege sticticalis TaxID=481309 RepID=A0ABD0S3Z8_LOXSC